MNLLGKNQRRFGGLIVGLHEAIMTTSKQEGVIKATLMLSGNALDV